MGTGQNQDEQKLRHNVYGRIGIILPLPLLHIQGKKGKELHRKQVEPLSDVKKCVLPLLFIGKC